MLRDPEQVEVEHLNAYADLVDASILEIGCGDGRLTWRYAHQAHHVTAIDPDPMRLNQAITHFPPELQSTVNFIHTDATQLPFPNQRFDGAILAWSL